MFDQQSKQAKASWQRNLWTGMLLLIIFLACHGLGRDPSSLLTRTKWKSQTISRCRARLSRAHRAERVAFLPLRLSWSTGSRVGGQPSSTWTGKARRARAQSLLGYRWENRFRIVPGEHWINPVLYVEFEDINAADKTLLEVVGHDGKADLSVPNDEARRERQREI